MQAATTYASNTRNATSVSYPHYELELGFTNGIKPAFMSSSQQSIPCAYCWGAFYYLCAPFPVRLQKLSPRRAAVLLDIKLCSDDCWGMYRYRMTTLLSYQNGIQGWFVSRAGMEFLGMTAYNSSYTGTRWGMTYIPQPNFTYAGTIYSYYEATYTTAEWVQRFDNIMRFPQAGQPYPGVPYGISYMQFMMAEYWCPAIDPSVYGTLSATPLTNASSTVCVYNCGLLPWRFSRSYAPAGSNSLPVTVPYQRFSMSFSGINTVDFQTNNHIDFDRDLFQLR